LTETAAAAVEKNIGKVHVFSKYRAIMPKTSEKIRFIVKEFIRFVFRRL